ncbi:MAG: type II toxin-antitoxin system RelE/ParE family toxin [Bacteroidetes bacterium]|nr:type II toxin-antitoxin system RelE/ParE family toxin [Bacteroidota bacterium]
MVAREVIWTTTAERQLQNTLEYWLNRNKSPLYSQKLLQLVDKYIQQICQRPTSFKLTEYANHRVCVMGVYSLYFLYSNNQIIITGFWDGRQNPKGLRKKLSKRK